MLRLILIPVALVLLMGCQQPRPQPNQATSDYAPVPPPSEAPATLPAVTPQIEPADVPKVEYDPDYDPEIKEVFRLADRNQWEQAQVKSAELLQSDPSNTTLERLNTWVIQEGKQLRQQALEDKIRSIHSKNSVYNPSAIDLITEQKDRGLPPRKDIRDAVDLIESMPWIPTNFNKTITEQGPLFDFEATKGPMGKVLDKEVSIHLDDVPFEAVILNLSQSSGVNIVADKTLPALTNRLTLNIDNVKLGEFFKYVGRNYEVQFQVGQDMVWVMDAKDQRQLMEETRFYKLRKGFILPAELGAEEVQVARTTAANKAVTITETTQFNRFVNDNAPAIPALEQAITNLFTGSMYMIDYERNLVVARGTIEQLELLEEIIKAFDQPIQQVLIEARFVTLSKPAFLQLGVLWETGRPTTADSGRIPSDLTGLLTDSQAAGLGLGIQYTFTNILDQATLTATLSALEQSGESQTLSAPRLTVLNNRPATINDGKVQYYYEEYQVKQTAGQYYTISSFVPSGKPTKITSGAELNVMASIAGDGHHMLLALNPSVKTDVQLVPYTTLTDYNQDGDLQSTFEIKLPQYRTQDIATRVVIKSGETVAMGGVLERQTTELVESVPVLGRIPYLGALFRRRTAVDTPRYLLVFVTATILNESGDGIIYSDDANSRNSD